MQCSDNPFGSQQSVLLHATKVHSRCTVSSTLVTSTTAPELPDKHPQTVEIHAASHSSFLLKDTTKPNAVRPGSPTSHDHSRIDFDMEADHRLPQDPTVAWVNDHLGNDKDIPSAHLVSLHACNLGLYGFWIISVASTATEALSLP